MIFNSFKFLVIFPLLFLLYYTIPPGMLRWRNGFLLLVSYLLYANWNPTYALLLLGVTVVTYIAARLIENKKKTTEKYKMMSMLYRHNSKFMQVLTDYVHPIFKIEGNGYLPLRGEMDRMKIKDISGEQISQVVDSQKIQFINKLIDELDGVKLVFVASPSWYGNDNDAYQPIKEICSRRNIPFVDFSNDKKYIHQYQYFKDGSHLNDIGADEFSRDLIKELKR